MKNINKKISRKFLWALAGLVAVAIFAVACSSAGSAGGSGSAGASSASDSGASEAYDGGTEDYRWASEDSAWDDSIMEMDGEEYLEAAPVYGEYDVLAESAPAVDAGGSAAAEEAPAAAYDEAVSFARTGSASLAAKGQKITFSASFSINTDHYDEDYRRINDLVNNAGGYIASENSNDYGYTGQSASGRQTVLTARVPAGQYDGLADALSGIGELANKTKSSQDLTAQYYDTDARIKMLEMRRDRLMGYLENTTEPKAVIVYEEELSDVLYELDAYQSDKRHMDSLVDYATIDVTLTELVTPATIGPDGQPLGDRASQAFQMSSLGVGAFLKSVAVFFAGAAPVLALLAALAAIVYGLVRLVRALRARLRVKREQEMPA